MKKFFFAAALVACSMFFASCDDGKPHCWELTVKGTCDGKNINESDNYWGTAEQLDAMITLMKEGAKAEGCSNVKISKKKNNKSQSDCGDDLW